MAGSRYKILLLMLAAFAAGGCSLIRGSSNSNGGGGRNRNANSDAGPAAVSITVAKSEGRDVPSTINATGTFVATETSDIAPKVAGKVSNVYVNAGQFVLGGAKIAKLDDRDA